MSLRLPRRLLMGHGLAAAALATSARAATDLIALVHTQAAGDGGPVDGMIAALKRVAAEHGLRPRAIYASDAATYETIFRTLGAAGASVVISTFNEVAQPIAAVAPSFPDTKYIQLFADPFTPAIPNVVTVGYDYYLGCFLAGRFAAQISATQQLGYIGGASIPSLNADLNGFREGVFSAASGAGVNGVFAGSFNDPAKGHDIAAQMFRAGVDVIQTDAAATDNGVIQAADEGANRLVSGVSAPQFKLGPATVPAIVQLDFGLSLYQQASRALQPGWSGGHIETGLVGGVIDFKRSPLFLAQGPREWVAKVDSVWPDIEATKAAIVAGTVKVPFRTSL